MGDPQGGLRQGAQDRCRAGVRSHGGGATEATTRVGGAAAAAPLQEEAHTRDSDPAEEAAQPAAATEGAGASAGPEAAEPGACTSTADAAELARAARQRAADGTQPPAPEGQAPQQRRGFSSAKRHTRGSSRGRGGLKPHQRPGLQLVGLDANA
eukprot:9268919-Pyramimonas_sp.AAC.1